jgi:lysophospholipase L1-like esterase
MEGIRLYNKMLKEIAEQEKILFIDMLDVLENKNLEDGMHPTAEGHEKMYIRIRDFLSDNEII